MKKTLLLAGLLLVVLAPMALAAESLCTTAGCGVDIAWGSECYTTALNSTIKTFACNTNTGNAAMCLSFVMDTDLPDFEGVDMFLYGQTAAATVPAWWQMATGECRGNNVLTTNNVYGGSGCVDIFGGSSSGGLVFYDGANTNPFGLAANRDRCEVLWAVGTPLDCPPSQENFVANVKFTYANTGGTGACAGCSTDHVWAFQLCQVAGQGGTTVDLDKPCAGGNQCLWWQHQNGALPCAPPVPAKSTTWGEVKSLYR